MQATGELVLRGRNLRQGMTVYFPVAHASAGRQRALGAPLRPTNHGLAVTIPAHAATGRIYVAASSRVKSKLYGPIAVLAAPRTPRPPVALAPGAAVAPVSSAFDAPGMWIWYLNDSDGGNVAAIAAQAQAAGIRTLYVKSSDGGSNYWSQFSPALVAQVHSLGLNICAWQYVYGSQPAAEAALGARAVAAGADCLVIDAEVEYDGRYAAAQTYMQDLRAAVGPNYPIGLASFPYVDYHESVPYSVFLGPGGAQYDVPQIYWHEIGDSPDVAYAHTFVQNRIYGRQITPLGQFYGSVPPAQVERFRQVAAAYGAPGISWWDWQSSTPALWSALTAPITDADTGHGRSSLARAQPRLAWRPGRLAPGAPRGRRACNADERDLRRQHADRARGLPGFARVAADGHRGRLDLALAAGAHADRRPVVDAADGWPDRRDRPDRTDRTHRRDGSHRRDRHDRHDRSDGGHRGQRGERRHPSALASRASQLPQRRSATFGSGFDALSMPMSSAKLTSRCPLGAEAPGLKMA